jgi:formiminotetrahydrofolate cyclodeaminase
MTAASAVGPAAARAGSAAASVAAAAARRAGDGSGAAQAAALATRLLRLAEEDVRVLADARAALAATGALDASARRDFALGQALESAAAVPLAIAEACADVVTLAGSLAETADSLSAPDLEGARFLAGGAARAAAHLVEVNLGVTLDDPRLARARAAAEAAAG